MAELTPAFLTYNTEQTKQINVVVQIEGVPGLMTSGPLFNRIAYGDPGLVYGGGAVYGGLKQVISANGGDVRQILALEGSSLQLTQRLEPEQGRGAVSTISLAFLDKDGYMTRLSSPGIIVPEILGARVKVFIGYRQLSYPEEYHQVFQGQVSNITNAPGVTVFQLSDPNLARRQKIFFSAQTKLTDYLDYNSRRIQSLFFKAKAPHGTDVNITYTAGGTAGAEVVSFTGPANISVQIQSGVSTAAQIKAAIEANVSASAVVDVSIAINFSGSDAQTTQSTLFLQTSTTVNVASNSDFYQTIQDILGNRDDAVKLYLKIDDEFIEYGPSASLPLATFGTNTFGGVARAQRGTVVSEHETGADVQAFIQIEDHGIDLALKIMLSGWAGPWKTAQPILSIRDTMDPILLDQPNAIILPAGTDAIRDYNMTPGDLMTISGASNGGNNIPVRVVSFADLNDQSNRIVYVDDPLILENPTTAVFSLRSQYDTLPILCGSKLDATDVDIERHLYLKNTFLSADENAYRFLISESTSGKEFIESQVYLPLACYSLTRFGQMSVGMTKPPLADLRLSFLTQDNITNPQELRPNRGVNNRRFFNEIVWNFDKDDAGDYTSTVKAFDSESVSLIRVSSRLPINADGARTDLGIIPLIDRRNAYFLSRYKRGAVELNPKVNFETAMKIEAGDIVAVQDEGTLKIPNINTGERDLGIQLFEVTERSLDIRTGAASLKLVSGVGGSATDRYGVVAPSSLVASGSSTTQIKIQDSYGVLYPGDEKKKWENYIGQEILVHHPDWAVDAVTTLQGFDTVDPYLMQVDPPLPWAPPAGYTVEVRDYPNDPDPTNAQIYKTFHCFLDPAVPVASGVSTTVFTVAPADITKFNVNQTVLVHEPDWTYYSPELKVVSVDSGTYEVEVSGDLGFTPALGDLVEFIGFPDNGGAYRFV